MNHERVWTIDVAPEDPERIRTVLIRAIDEDGQPVAGAAITVRIEGHGTLESGLEVAKKTLPTMEDGHVIFEWYEYPRFNPRQPLHSEVVFSCDDPRVLSISARRFLEIVF